MAGERWYLLVLIVVGATVQDQFAQRSATLRHTHLNKHLAQHPHTNLTTPELIVRRGYPAQVHHVITDDGYILELHRIPHGRHGHPVEHSYSTIQARPSPYRAPHHRTRPYAQYKSDNRRRWEGHMLYNRTLLAAGRRSGQPRVVFLQHGLLSSSADYVMNDPEQALAFLLADAGYDVWLGNLRGNFYSRRHLYLSPEELEFWDHSWNELARYDLPAMLSYVRTTTGAAQVSYIGHSMGASLLFAMLNYHPHLHTWVRVMAALAPAAYIHNRKFPLGVLSPFVKKIDETLLQARFVEVMRLTPSQAALRSTLCGPAAITSLLCTYILFLIHGPNSSYLDKKYLPVLSSHWPAGTGLHVFTHLLQLHASRRFQAFDYGQARNLAEYGRTFPPPFSLSRVKLPVGIFWSENDWIAEPVGVQQTASELPWLALNYRVKLSDFNHMDFLWAENAHNLVYRPVMDFFDTFY